MVRNYQRKTADLWTTEDLTEALRQITENKRKINHVSREYGISRATLYRHVTKFQLSNLESLEAYMGATKTVGGTSILTRVEEMCMANCILNLRAEGNEIGSKEVKQICFEYCEANDIPNRFRIDKRAASDDWYYAFLKRHPEVKLEGGNGGRKRKVDEMILEPENMKVSETLPQKRSNAQTEKRYAELDVDSMIGFSLPIRSSSSAVHGNANVASKLPRIAAKKKEPAAIILSIDDVAKTPEKKMKFSADGGRQPTRRSKRVKSLLPSCDRPTAETKVEKPELDMIDEAIDDVIKRARLVVEASDDETEIKMEVEQEMEQSVNDGEHNSGSMIGEIKNEDESESGSEEETVDEHDNREQNDDESKISLAKDATTSAAEAATEEEGESEEESDDDDDEEEEGSSVSNNPPLPVDDGVAEAEAETDVESESGSEDEDEDESESEEEFESEVEVEDAAADTDASTAIAVRQNAPAATAAAPLVEDDNEESDEDFDDDDETDCSSSYSEDPEAADDNINQHASKVEILVTATNTLINHGRQIPDGIDNNEEEASTSEEEGEEEDEEEDEDKQEEQEPPKEDLQKKQESDDGNESEESGSDGGETEDDYDSDDGSSDDDDGDEAAEGLLNV